MPVVHFLPALAAALLALAAPAHAQQAAGDVTLREATDDDLMVPPFNLSVEDLEDADLVDPAGAEIGEVEEVLVDADGQPAAITAEVGGFLGVGQKMAVIGLDRLQLKDGDLVILLSKEQLGSLQSRSGQ
jgi:hypothetical protein